MARRSQRQVGRPSSYTPEIAAEICRRLANDESLTTICADVYMPARDTVYQWRRDHPEFSDSYARAREDQGHTVADGIGDIRRKLLAGELNHQSARAAADMAKWEASRRASKDFGDRVDVTSSDGSMSPPSLADFYADLRAQQRSGS